MNEILIAGAIMCGLAGFFGLVLAVSHRYLKVEEDPRIEIVEGMLPGTNCGACGQPGCHGFAEALVGAEASPGQCTVSSPDAIGEIAGFLGVDAGFQEKRVARLHCAGGTSSVRKLAEYQGDYRSDEVSAPASPRVKSSPPTLMGGSSTHRPGSSESRR